MQRRRKRLDKELRSELLSDLLESFKLIRNKEDVALFMQDLLTRDEAEKLAKRLRIAKLLIEGKTYEQIESNLSVSHGTVARVAGWLSQRGEGFRAVASKLPSSRKTKHWSEYSDWDRIKRRYPSYFWPELLLEEIVKSASKRDKERLLGMISNLEEKDDLHKRIQKALKYNTT